jgi:hypothetical protein
MAAIADLVLLLADGTTSVTYKPKLIRNGFVVWRESAVAIESARTITLQELPVKKGSKQLRMRISFFCPIMEIPAGSTTSGYQAGPKVAFPITWNFDFTTHTRATEAQNEEAVYAITRLSSPTVATALPLRYALTKNEFVN